MRYIEEEIITKIRPEMIWRIWADNHLKKGYEKGKYFSISNHKGIKYKIDDFKKNESLTLTWKSFFVKLIFYHHVKPLKHGSLITCKVKIKGFLSFLIKPFIASKIRKHLKISLSQFSGNLNRF